MYHHILRCALVMSLALFPVSFRGAEKVEADSDGKTFDSIEAALDGASGEVKLTLGEGDFSLPAVVPAGVTSLDIEGMGGSKVVFPASGN